MTTQQDYQIGVKKETTFGTAVVVDKFFEFTDEDLAQNPTFTQGTGLRYGRRVAASNRRRVTKYEPGGSFTTELITKSLGALVEAALGASTSTVIAAGAAYQQLFTPTTTDPLSSYTIQEGVPLVGGGASSPQTFVGMVCNGFDFTLDNSGLATIKWNWLGKDVNVSTALATAAYPTGTDIFSFVDATLVVGGTVVVPTATTLATGGTAASTVRDINLSYDNGLDGGGFNVGSGGKRARKPAMGLRKISGTLTAEYSDNVLRDAFLAQSDIALVLTLTRSDLLISGTSYPTFQIVIPDIRLEGELPKANGSDIVTQSISFTGFDGGVAAQPIYIAIVTAETAV